MGSNKPRVIIDGKAQCRECLEWFPIESFPLMRNGGPYEYRLRSCQTCRTARAYATLNANPVRYIDDKWARTRVRSKKIGALFSISRDDFRRQFESQDGLCFYTDITMVTVVGQGKHPHAASVDKIIPHLGYVRGNVVFTANRVNTMKHDATLDEMALWMPEWHKRAIAHLDKDGI